MRAQPKLTKASWMSASRWYRMARRLKRLSHTSVRSTTQRCRPSLSLLLTRRLATRGLIAHFGTRSRTQSGRDGNAHAVHRIYPRSEIQIVILSAQLMLRSLVLMLTREKPLPGQLGLPYAQAKALVALGRRDKRPGDLAPLPRLGEV